MTENKIKILPQHIANRIAAGEVIGRPESAIKELIENSLDAGAENIWLRIKDAGKTFIQVIDDAAGMGNEDARLCMQRHSTSKISNAGDLENIRTLGFRGEALASICAVSQVEMKTRTEIDELGTLIRNNGNEIIECSRIQTEKGTAVTVKNLFYNTPARRNFLKSDQTEFKHIYDTFIRLAISYPSVSFSLVNDDEEIFCIKPDTGGKLNTRLEQIFGKTYFDSLIEVTQKFPLISVYGFISKPNFTKKNKQDQFLYVNNRYVINKSLSYAVHLAYEDLIEKGDYPNFFLFLTLDPHQFDVNVHPSKLEIKFEDEKAIFNFVRGAVKKSLANNDLILKSSLGKSYEYSYKEQETRMEGPVFNENEHFPTSGFRFKKFSESNIVELFSGISKQAQEDSKSSSQKGVELESYDHLIGKYALWQFQNKYIMYQLENTLMIIDQHAAHERILYEQAVERLNSNANLSQQLLIPIYTDLSHVDFELAKSLSDELRALGFNIEFLSKRKIKIIGIPSDVRVGNEENIIQELIDEFKMNDVKLNLDKRDNIAKSYACKHAIRTGDKLSNDEMLNLIDKLFSVEMPYVCPHGRPTIIKIPIEELDKKFARTGF